MKQKLILLLLSVGIITFLFSCSNDDEKTGENKLPQTARAFIESHFPNHTILSVDETDDLGDEFNEKYLVQMSDDVVLSFSSMGFWRRIESSKALPELAFKGVVPYDGVDKIKTKYPSATINMIHFKLYGYMVTLSDDTKLAFYDVSSSGKFGIDYSKNIILLPENLRSIITKYYSDIARNNPYYIIQVSQEDGLGYRFAAREALVHFDEDGDWYYVSGGTFSIPSELYQTLPDASRDILKKEYNGGPNASNSPTALLKNEEYYAVQLSNSYSNFKKWYLFNAGDGQEMRVPQQAVYDFLKAYVAEPDKDMVWESEIILNKDKAIFRLVGKVNDKAVMTVYADKDGRILGLTLAGTEIPKTVLGYLPAKVKEYVEKNKPNAKIYSISNGFDGLYYLLFDDNSRLNFDKEGNILN